MHRPAHGRLRQQVDSLRQQFLQQDGLPFADVLSTAGLQGALQEVPSRWNDRIFTPLVGSRRLGARTMRLIPWASAASARSATSR
jgi:hypothetical protein